MRGHDAARPLLLGDAALYPRADGEAEWSPPGAFELHLGNAKTYARNVKSDLLGRNFTLKIRKPPRIKATYKSQV